MITSKINIIICSDINYCSMIRYDEEELRAKYLQNVSKGILINKDYSRLGSKNSKKGSKLNNTLDRSFTPNSSLYHRNGSMKKARNNLEVDKLRNMLK